MGSTSDFVKQSKKEMPTFVRTAIDNLLKKMNSSITMPRNMYGKVVEGRLLAVVKSREEIYNAIVELMDINGINKDSDAKYKKKIIEALTKTWHELTTLIVRSEPFDDDMADFNEGEDGDSEASDNVSDDKFSSIAKSIVTAAKLADNILARIAMLDDPESVNNEKIDNYQLPSIAERYARK